MAWIMVGVVLMLLPPLAMLALLVGLHIWLRVNYLHNLDRIFLEKPLFIIPRGQPDSTGEDVSFGSTDGLKLRGCYLPATNSPRKGVNLFGLEFGSNRWAAVPACADLRAAGFDVFAYEPRNQGDSDTQLGFEPMQWI